MAHPTLSQGSAPIPKRERPAFDVTRPSMRVNLTKLPDLKRRILRIANALSLDPSDVARTALVEHCRTEEQRLNLPDVRFR